MCNTWLTLPEFSPCQEAHVLDIDADLRLHGVPRSWILACIVLLNLHHPLPCRFWSAPLPSHLRRPPEWHNTVIRWILSWNVTDPVLFSSPHFTTDVFSHCHLQNCLVRDMLLPSVENSSRAISLKGVYPLFLCFGELPSLTSIKQNRQDKALEKGDFGVYTYIHGLSDVL